MENQKSRAFIDRPIHVGLRRKMVDELMDQMQFSKSILNSFLKIPRHLFFDEGFEHKAYLNKAFPISNDQTISHPFTVAYQTHLLEIKPEDKILEIGTGSGFQAAILACLCNNVFSIERHANLSEKAKLVLNHLGLSVQLFVGDGTNGLKNNAPFDKIIVTAAAPEIPKTYINQLKVGGILVIPVGDKNQQKMLKVIKTDENNAQITDTEKEFKFVPLIGEQGWE